MIGKSIVAVSDVHLGMIIGENKPASEKYRENLSSWIFWIPWTSAKSAISFSSEIYWIFGDMTS